MSLTLPSSCTSAAQELVVPRSMPMIGLFGAMGKRPPSKTAREAGTLADRPALSKIAPSRRPCSAGRLLPGATRSGLLEPARPSGAPFRQKRGTPVADAERTPSPRPQKAGRYLGAVGSQVKAAFDSDRTILSFDEYLELLLSEPRTHARNAAQYLRDVFDHFGSETRQTPAGAVRRFKLFDLDTDGEGRVAGQEEVQNALYKALGNFVRLGRVNKLILLHGPNGSAKSSLVAALMRAMEVYSRRPQGALYRFNWIFPSARRCTAARSASARRARPRTCPASRTWRARTSTRA
jgi:hypothetical protein